MTFANLSGGRDSTCVVVKWLENGNNLDYILFCDTGFEFSEMYKYIDKLDSYLLRNFNKKITRLDSSKQIEKWAFEYPIQSGEKQGRLRGLPKTIGKEYCTRETKVKPSEKFIIDKSPNKFKNIILIGYTYNEVENGRVTHLNYGVAKYPLHEWRMNEPDVDCFLKTRGIANPLYERFSRTGCFFCPKQSKRSLYNVYKHYPKQWQIMLDFEAKARSLNCVNQTWKIDKPLSEFEKEFSQVSETLFDDKYDIMETCFCK